jgi:hypothetical protein
MKYVQFKHERSMVKIEEINKTRIRIGLEINEYAFTCWNYPCHNSHILLQYLFY